MLNSHSKITKNTSDPTTQTNTIILQTIPPPICITFCQVFDLAEAEAKMASKYNIQLNVNSSWLLPPSLPGETAPHQTSDCGDVSLIYLSDCCGDDLPDSSSSWGDCTPSDICLWCLRPWRLIPAFCLSIWVWLWTSTTSYCTTSGASVSVYNNHKVLTGNALPSKELLHGFFNTSFLPQNT